MDIDSRFAPQCVREIALTIAEAGGGEVAFVCTTNEDGCIVAADPVARGVEDMVAAPMMHLERGDVVVHNHPSGVLLPSRADVSVAAELADSGIGFYIVNNEVTEVTVVCEPVAPATVTPIDPDELAGMLDDGGRLSELSTDFEPRESQLEMVKAVASAFNEDQVLAVEAGTGVGKSYAYLIPALAWAQENEERVVISTATINLQQQLLDKDIPMVQRILGTDLPVVLVKGRGNYLCSRRLKELVEEQSLFNDLPSEQADESGLGELEAIREWARTTKTGSRTDLPFVVSDELWSQINADPDHCTDATCRMRDDCFFQRSRRAASAARVLIVNHHLLFVDLALRVRGIGFESRAVLPPFERLIFDEAHSIESSATSLFSESFSLFAVRKHTRRLVRARGGRALGLLARIRQRGASNKGVVQTTDQVRFVEEAAEALNSATTAAVPESTFRFTPQTPADTISRLLEPVAELHSRLIVLSNMLTDLLEDDDGDETGPFQDVRIIARRIERIVSLCDEFREFQNNSDRVYWIEIRRSGAGLRFCQFISSPLDISTVMREAVFDNFETVVFTSATLTVAGSFDFWGGRIGLSRLPREVTTQHFDSPFRYEESALVAVPTDAPAVQDSRYTEFLHSFLGSVLEVSEGRALVLFTSYEMLRNAYAATRERLAERGIASLKQGDDDRARLLARFRDDVSSVLFATESFWQGVDAPGETLQLVVLCRLPFRVPTDPVLMARTEAMEARGGNAFLDLSLPEAIMRFRQGFGRLIRRGSDRGVVIVTDVRLINKRYGQQFFLSLPPAQRCVADSSAVLSEVERFLYP